jgi:hypothetical protein
MFVSWCEILNPSFITDVAAGQRSQHNCIRWIWMRQAIRFRNYIRELAVKFVTAVLLINTCIKFHSICSIKNSCT